ncbi:MULTISPECIES: PAS domain-containing protein [Salinibaculum]|uniref:PAS domain-containing protein n=1 Tax=Salinibaculum TaxID=2732368 RepID=UPI0030D230D8
MSPEESEQGVASDIVERVSDGIVALDTDLSYRYVNERAERILGKDRADLVGESVWDVWPEAADTVAQDAIERAMETGQQTSFERYNASLETFWEVDVHPSDDGVTLLCTDITEAKAAERKLDRIVETAPVGIAVLDETGEITRANTRAEDLLGLEDSEMQGRTYADPGWNIWDEDGDPIARGDHPVEQVVETGETVQGFTHGITLPDGSERWLSSNVAPVCSADGCIEQMIVALQDITVLKRLEQLIETFQPVTEVLAHATSRTETEREVCELLTDTREYDIAAVAEHTPGTDLLEPNVQSGPAADIFAAFDPPLTDIEPVETAAETGTVQVVHDLQARARSATAREQLRAYDLRHAAAIPFVYGNRVYGFLGLYTGRADAFGEREQTLLQTLGEQIGHVIHALETEQLLHTNTVVELTFRSTDPGSFLVQASEELGCSLSVTETIPRADDAMVYYVTVEDAPVAALERKAAAADGTVGTRTIRERNDDTGGVVEIVSEGESLAHTLVTLGAVVATDRVVDGKAEVSCEIPAVRDVSALVDSLTASFPETELAAKRERQRAPAATEQSDERLADVYESDLSDRQRQVLRAAIYSGYFESPRRSSASDIAEALSLTQSTVSYHLRNAQQTLFERMVDQL